ncbi:unnamed protein product [Arabidopsis lyrata]|uniref:Predicted protein n=1 Tax=Arabidopsis lyrata subsp. lyrata TaxID=81972 RepID=D7LTI4_ARALL|nr:uncharacterized protein LOC9313836 [Arabidopsis lyrata subsp. lyrata]EFH52303.1 predicted protein [Arabidopsis lyrata subsp. lyrata]CAH8268170.1 unnamed protein product [Arabidopsis lyrata]|eukprot:XP_002876044.1 uncharacterized protein LOC9313836 [Arabidopsis lyrata subsp. lyrata]
MALRAPLLMFVRLAANQEINASTKQFHEVLRAVENRQSRARFVVVAFDANPNLRIQIEAACVRHGVLMFHVPSNELRIAAHGIVPVVACAILRAPRGNEGFLRMWINMLNTISGLEEQLGYHPTL